MRDVDDLRWARRLQGIRKPETFADPTKVRNFTATRLLLEAGLQLKEEHFAKGDGGAVHGLIRVTRENVAARALRLGGQHENELDGRLQSFTGAFNERWSAIDHYRRDLLIYELYSQRWREAFELLGRRLNNLTELAASGSISGSNLVCEVVALDASLRSRFIRYSISQAGLTTDPALRDLAVAAHGEFMTAHRDQLIGAYLAIQQRFGISLRPGITLETVSRCIAWIVRGGAWDANVAGDDGASHTIAEAVMALIVGTVDLGDGKDVQTVINQLCIRRNGPDSKEFAFAAIRSSRCARFASLARFLPVRC